MSKKKCCENCGHDNRPLKQVCEEAAMLALKEIAECGAVTPSERTGAASALLTYIEDTKQYMVY